MTFLRALLSLHETLFKKQVFSIVPGELYRASGLSAPPGCINRDQVTVLQCTILIYLAITVFAVHPPARIHAADLGYELG